MKIFLSYSTEDGAVARKLASQLEQAGFDTWDPAEARFPGDNWALRIGKALQESDAMVVLISPKAMKSESVRQEVEYAISSPHYKGRLIPVMVKPTKDMLWILKRFPLVTVGRDLSEAVRQIASHIELGFELTPLAT